MIHLEEKSELQTIVVTLDRPEQGHSLGKDAAKTLSGILKKYKKSNLILQATGSRFFCTGGNLTEQIRAKSPQESYKTQLTVRAALGALHQHPRLTVALVNGDCFGGGMELLSCFDLVLSAPHVHFGLWQRRLGLSFGWGGGRRLLQRSSLSDIKNQVLLSRSICSYEASKLGWVDEIHPSDKLTFRAYELLTQHLCLPQTNFPKLKSWDGKKEEAIFGSLWMKADHHQALTKHSKT